MEGTRLVSISRVSCREVKCFYNSKEDFSTLLNSRVGRNPNLQLEPFTHPFPTINKIISDIELVHVSNAVIAFLFAASAPVAIILGVGTKAGLSESDMASWIFGAFVLNGMIGIVVSIIYRQPLAGTRMVGC